MPEYHAELIGRQVVCPQYFYCFLQKANSRKWLLFLKSSLLFFLIAMFKSKCHSTWCLFWAKETIFFCLLLARSEKMFIPGFKFMLLGNIWIIVLRNYKWSAPLTRSLLSLCSILFIMLFKLISIISYNWDI